MEFDFFLKISQRWSLKKDYVDRDDFSIRDWNILRDSIDWDNFVSPLWEAALFRAWESGMPWILIGLKFLKQPGKRN